MSEHRLQRYFVYDHLPPYLQDVVQIFHAAMMALQEIPAIDEAERAAAIRKLLEAKDCAVRSALEMHDS